MRYLLAIEQVKTKAKQLNLTDEQKAQLKEREATERSAAESAFLKLYTEVWLPRVEEGALGIEKVAAGGRPLQTTLNEKKQAMIHERIIELLTNLQPRIFGSLNPAKIAELFRLGEGDPPRPGIRAAEVAQGFYSFLGFTRLTTSAVLRRAIARGVQEGTFAYTSGAIPKPGADGKFEVAPSRVRHGTAVAEDEIDLETGFLMLPEAVPQAEPPPELGQPPSGPSPEPGAGPTSPGPVSSPPSGPDMQRTVELSFEADRDQLYGAWSALANLADMAGRVRVIVRAESKEGFDQNRLRNGVIEPLQEADLIE